MLVGGFFNGTIKGEYMRFSIIIPNYNSSKYILKCLNSISNQTYKNYEVIIIDDMSTDNSCEIIKNYNKIPLKLIELTKKAYNGGTRNIGVKESIGEYIIFMDCDDWFYNESVLEKISREIDSTHADLIRLPYQAYTTTAQCKIPLKEKTLKELANTIFVAPWTKCVKKEKFIEFPENTLLEDVVQHIAQIDNIETIGYVGTPVIVWNRSNENAISSAVAKYDKTSKRYSSVYRNMADLLDLKCKHDYCEGQRLFRIKNYEDIIQRGDILGLINGVNAK